MHATRRFVPLLALAGAAVAAAAAQMVEVSSALRLAQGIGQAAAPPVPELPPLDTGNTAWMITATALVLMMAIPGVALFYGGMVRKKNVLATLMQVFATCCVITIVWMVLGYSLANPPRLEFARFNNCSADTVFTAPGRARADMAPAWPRG